MSSVDEHLRRWSEAGLLDAEQAARIRDFEASHAATRTAPSEERPGVIEAVLYLGLAIAGAGAFFLGAENWDDLESWARIAALAVPTLLATIAGAAFRSLDEHQFRRAGHLAWMVAVALATGTVAVISSEGGVDDERVVLIMGTVATVVAVVLWSFAPSYPQILALGAALFLLAQGIASSPGDYDAVAGGLALFLLGLIGIAFAEAEMLRPQPAARMIFGAFAIAGPYFAGIEESVLWAELLVFVVGAALIALAIQRNTFLYMVIAVTGMFIGLITFVFEHLEESIGVALSLLLSGAAIVAGVLLLAALRNATKRETA